MNTPRHTDTLTTETEHTPTPMRGVGTFVDEAQGFIRRNKLEGQQATFGGLAWGFMRALLECDHCPGVFRVPFDEDRRQIKSMTDKREWKHLYCPNCKGVWTKAEGKDSQ